jgi:anti-anti-sigma factor
MGEDSTAEVLQVSSEETASASVLHVHGEVDAFSAPLLQEQLMRRITEGRGVPVIVDCAELRYLDMKGVRVLENCHRRAERQGVRLVIVGSSPLVHRILTIVELDQRIPVVDTMGEALKALGLRE